MKKYEVKIDKIINKYVGYWEAVHMASFISDKHMQKLFSDLSLHMQLACKPQLCDETDEEYAERNRRYRELEKSNENLINTIDSYVDSYNNFVELAYKNRDPHCLMRQRTNTRERLKLVINQAIEEKNGIQKSH